MSSFVPDPLDNLLPPLGEPNHPEHPQDPGGTNLIISEIIQVVVNSMCHLSSFITYQRFPEAILAMLCFVINQLFRLATPSVPDPLGDALPLLSEEPSHPEHTQDQGDTNITSGIQHIAITAIRATDLTLGLRRIPAGFHVTVQADGVEWQTSNKSVHVDQTVVEWNEHILLPSEPSSKVRVRLYASFELGSMLDHGELLRTFEISVRELLDRSRQSHPIVFKPKPGQVVSSCTSLLMTVEQRRSDENDAAALPPLTTLMTSDMHTLLLKTDAGHCLLARYRRTQNSRDLDQCIKHFEGAFDLCAFDHPCHPAALFNLATAKFISCQANGTYLDLDIPISLFQDALDMRPTGHLDRVIIQLHLAIALLSRFVNRGSQADADAAEELLNEVLDISLADSHVYRAALLAIETSALARSTDANILRAEGPVSSMLPWSPNELARRAELCFRRDDPQAVDEVISLHYDALGYYSTAHDERGQLLCNLGAMLMTRFQRRGNIQDLDEGIALLRQVPVGHQNWSASLNNLATQLTIRFEHRGNIKDMDEAIPLHWQALALFPVGYPDRSASLNNLANQLSNRFKHQGNAQDLDEAIPLHREALTLFPVGHPDRSVSLNNLATTLSTRFNHRGNDQDLDEAISLHEEALALPPVGHPDRSASLDNLANQLSNRFKHRGNDQDLDEAIPLHREALALRLVGHPDRFASLHNLGNQLSTRFQQRGNDQDLDEAISLHREALALFPVGYPDRCGSLNKLGCHLSTRFKHRGNGQDIEEAISLHREALALHPVGHPDREALALRPNGHPDRSVSLNNLANQLSTCFELRGNDRDLDEAISLHREALALLPVGHSDWFMSLNNLAAVLSVRFRHRGDDRDLNEAIPLYREALALTPVGYPDQSTTLNNLANQLSNRFKRRSNDQDLDEAIPLYREALALRPVGYLNRSASLHNLGNQLSARFQCRGNDQDSDEAISLHREALALCPVGHPDRCASLNNLWCHLTIRFEHRGNAQDLDESLDIHYRALALLMQDDPRQISVHSSLANIYLLFHRPGLDGSINAAMHHLKVAANTVSGGLLSRLRASIKWVRHADQHTHGTVLEAYATSMQLLDTYMSATASVSSRHDIMKVFPRALAVDAASCTLRHGDVRHAVELLERGRTLIWTQMARFRTPLDSLQKHGDHAKALTEKFRDLSSLLDKPPAGHQEGTPRVNAEAEATRYRHLVEDWNTAAEEIRKIEGFGRFLLPPLFSELQDAARDGPIIVLVASKSSCDAIIVPHWEPPVSVGLAINVEKLVRLVSALQQAVKNEEEKQAKLIEVLRELWAEVVHPVVVNLGKVAKPGSRIWWCPTSLFNFLPLHAAGEYRPSGKSLSQLYISSYTPSLTALVKARRRHDRSLPVSFAAIGQNHPPEHSFLPCVEPELDLVHGLLPPSPTVSFTKVTSVESTKSTALRTLRDNHWIHFACHGTQNFVEPFKSAFLMRDEPLQLLDISHTDLSRHEFAFLSACETAVGDFKTPDEAIHLAAGLQFSGVKSVIGTFWNVNDSTVQRLVEEFYKDFAGMGR
ncbi:CHAT domain-containing protein [Suillus paluster]|uniref:CHAT domain-containing protein n=1 Tax=Suillus paluster TaxID=48578 RepID=UPI001B8832BD|nr:CHAT domain-containing protein [Suillus paluster]KAG1748294.1 CHAT domain-containing protein [Suillus paluster]